MAWCGILSWSAHGSGLHPELHKEREEEKERKEEDKKEEEEEEKKCLFHSLALKPSNKPLACPGAASQSYQWASRHWRSFHH